MPEDTGKIELSGTLQVDTAESTWDLIGTGGNVSGQVFKLNYKKESGDNIGTTYFLSGDGNTYKDQSGFSSPYPCVKYADGSSFDPDNITAAGEVICYDTHANDGTGKCSRCGEKIDYIAEIDLSKIVEYCTNNPFRGNAEVENNYNEYYIVWVKKSGSYKITGSNFVNNAYCDIRRIYGYVQRYVRRGGKGNYSCTRDFAEWRNIYRFAEGIHHLPDSRRGYLLHH